VAQAPAGGNGGATDIGITADSITVGNVSDLSGPVPGLFQGAVIGTQAYFAKVNASGGIFGRQLKLRVADGQLDCDHNKAQHRALKDKVFAFVGSFSLYDGCGATVLGGSGVPDIHNSLSQDSLKLPNNFSVAPLPPGWRTGPLKYYKAKYGEKFKHIGTIYAQAGGADATWRAAKQAIIAEGGNIDYERGFGPTETDFTADIVAMRRAGVQMIYITASDAPTFARVVQAAKQQAVDWPIAHGGIAYDAGFLPRAGSQAEGVVGDQQFALFFNKDEVSLIPAVGEFQKWTSKVAPGEKTDLFAVFGWASAQLFVQALTKAGANAKRTDLLRQLATITSFDADGLLAPANPAQKKPATCWIATEVKNGKFVRVQTPQKYRCDGGFFKATPS
jgi:ABC-type branched-subunit amino acid transport system substrate-binding protein